MKLRLLPTGLSIAVLTASAGAQTLTSSGSTATTGNVPYVSAATSASTTISPSPITVSGSTVGIGTSTGGLLTVGTGAPFRVNNSGEVFMQGYITATPFTDLGGIGFKLPTNTSTANIFGGTNPYDGGYVGARGAAFTQDPSQQGQVQLVGNITGAASTAGAILFAQYDGSAWLQRMIVDKSGNLGIGVPNPQAKLEVNGNLRFTVDGSVQTTAWTGVLCGGDYAEAVNASGGKKAYEPGDVLVLTSDANGDVQKSSEPYSTMVAGIYATKPGVIGKRQLAIKDSDEVPMAMVGIVPTKVTAENGPIHRGDLLVSSSQIGYAMKGTDRTKMLGAVIGKAMGSLGSGTGVIEILVTLQ